MINLSFLRRFFQKLILRYIYLFVDGRFLWKSFFLLASTFDEKIRKRVRKPSLLKADPKPSSEHKMNGLHIFSETGLSSSPR